MQLGVWSIYIYILMNKYSYGYIGIKGASDGMLTCHGHGI
jgi:hypothetical protein